MSCRKQVARVGEMGRWTFRAALVLVAGAEMAELDPAFRSNLITPQERDILYHSSTEATSHATIRGARCG